VASDFSRSHTSCLPAGARQWMLEERNVRYNTFWSASQGASRCWHRDLRTISQTRLRSRSSEISSFACFDTRVVQIWHTRVACAWLLPCIICRRLSLQKLSPHATAALNRSAAVISAGEDPSTDTKSPADDSHMVADLDLRPWPHTALALYDLQKVVHLGCAF